MGAGISSAALSQTTSLVTFLDEFEDVSYDKILGSARFLKSVRAKTQDGIPVVVKVFPKPGPDVSFTREIAELNEQQNLLSSVPNVCTHFLLRETDTAVVLMRQYFFSSLYDRISTRPFLENIEKRWIAYQMLLALYECHSRGVHHGDIKTENVLVTSWNWVCFADFAPYKPIFIPEDNPADFSFYFDTSSRRICYLAPERFQSRNESSTGSGMLTDAMDIFSLGCVIAELFMDGSPMFTLSQLFRYKRGEYDPFLPYIDKIDDFHIRVCTIISQI